MTDIIEFLVIVAFVLLIVFIAAPNMFRKTYDCVRSELPDVRDVDIRDSESFIDEPYVNEPFTAVQETDNTDYISGTDPMASYENVLRPRGSSKNYESLIYDSTTGSIFSGSEFMEQTGISTPYWSPPAWAPDALGPSSKDVLDPADYENDPRLLYNKCSLSCCSPQYPVPFESNNDPFVCDKNGNSKYLPSSYTCTNNTGGTGCLCMSKSQVRGMETGYFDSYVDSQKNE